MPSATDSTVADPSLCSTIVELFDLHARRNPQGPHIRVLAGEQNEQVLTFEALSRGAQEVADGLNKFDVVGQTVGIMLPTGGDYFLAFLGTLRAGGIPVPIYPPLNPATIEDHLERQAAILSNAGTATLIADSQVKPVANILKRRVETLQRVLTVDDIRAAQGTRNDYVPAETDLALLQYTSGSTGQPKGVILTHAQLLANLRAMEGVADVRSDDIFISWLPLYHDMGLIGAWFGMLYCGAQLVIMSPLQFLSRPSRWLHAIDRYRGTISASPNFGYERCLGKVTDAELEGLDLSTWRLAFNGAEMVRAETVRRFTDRFSPYGFRAEAMKPVYGMAECALGIAFPRGDGVVIDRIDRKRFADRAVADPASDEDPSPLEFVSCGSALPGYEMRIVGEEHRPLQERQQGRIEIRGPSVTSGYYRNPEATRELFVDGWLDSGDLGYFADGELFITGRAKDVIVRAGQNIYPEELEEAVASVPGIRKGRVAAFGARDAKTGSERVIVVAETRHRRKEPLQRLRSAARKAALRRTGTVPDELLLVQPQAIPKTSSGKLRRSDCRNLYERGELRPADRKGLRLNVARLMLQTEALSQKIKEKLIPR